MTQPVAATTRPFFGFPVSPDALCCIRNGGSFVAFEVTRRRNSLSHLGTF